MPFRVCFTLLLIVNLLTVNVFSQDTEYFPEKKSLYCSYIAEGFSLSYVKFMQDNEIDSVKVLLKEWEETCGLNEPVYRAKIILALKTEEFNDSLWAEKPFDFIFNYQSRMDIIQFIQYNRYLENRSYYGYVPVGERFDNYTRRLAEVLKDYYDEESVEYLLAEFYSEDYEIILSRIHYEHFENTLLKTKYYELLNKSLKMPEFHFAFLTGLWIPTGALNIVGLHPEIAVSIGCKRKKMNFDLIVAMKFIKSSKEYLARRDKKSDKWEETNRFLGGYIGFEVGGDVFVRNRHEIQAIGGIGYDGFYVLSEKGEVSYDDYYRNYNSNVATSSYNINFGVSYRYYFSSHAYVGLRVKYNIVDYSLNKVTDFTGNPIVVQISVGLVKSSNRDIYLSALGYAPR
jgi:hypothetical protein